LPVDTFALDHPEVSVVGCFGSDAYQQLSFRQLSFRHAVNPHWGHLRSPVSAPLMYSFDIPLVRHFGHTASERLRSIIFSILH